MVLFLLIEALQSLWRVEFVGSAEVPSLILYAVTSLLTFCLHPVILGVFIAAAPLMALKKNRSVVVWLLLGILLGPFALVVAALPPRQVSHVPHGEEHQQPPPLAQRRVGSRRSAVLLLLATWVIAYLYSFGHYLGDDLLLSIKLIPAAVAFGWMILPGNTFRVITGVESAQHLTSTVIVSFWLILIPLHVAFLMSKLQIILIAIVVALLISSHGCYHWVTYESFD